MSAEIDLYQWHLRLWGRMLNTFLGWNDVPTARWTSQFKEGIENQYSMFYNQPPEFYVARLLTPRRLLPVTGERDVPTDIQGILQLVLDRATLATIDDIDWTPARQEIDQLLQRYGASLDEVAKERADWCRDSENELILPDGAKVHFDLPIKQTAEVGDVIIVVLAVPAGTVMTENVFGVSKSGKILWQIEHIPGTATNPINHYDGIYISGKSVQVTNWNGGIVELDVLSGKATWLRWER